MQKRNNKLIDAVIRNNNNDVPLLLKAGADPNYYEDVEGFRPLHYAALHDAANVITTCPEWCGCISLG